MCRLHELCLDADGATLAPQKIGSIREKDLVETVRQLTRESIHHARCHLQRHSDPDTTRREDSAPHQTLRQRRTPTQLPFL